MRSRHMLVIALVLALLWWPGGVLAHAHLVASDPVDGGRLDDSNASVELQFSEGIEVAFSRFMLHGDDDATAPAAVSPASYRLGADRRSVVLRFGDALPAGAWRLDWTVLAEDGHTTTGTLTFRVGD